MKSKIAATMQITVASIALLLYNIVVIIMRTYSDIEISSLPFFFELLTTSISSVWKLMIQAAK